jgi:hypothetical protein
LTYLVLPNNQILSEIREFGSKKSAKSAHSANSTKFAKSTHSINIADSAKTASQNDGGGGNLAYLVLPNNQILFAIS